MSAREIDLAGRPTNRATWFVRLVVRLGQILIWLAVTTVLLPFFVLARRSVAGGLGGAVTFLCERLGATFIKIGQIVSTRPDVFPAAFVSSLVALQDRVPPFRFADVRATIEEDFGRKLEDIFAEVDPEPVASGSVAQVHRAVLQHAELPSTFAARVVAIKVRRPGIVRRAYLDEAILRFGARLLSLLPGFSLLSPLEAAGEFCEAVNKQLDFRIEAESNRQFRKNFENDVDIVVPALVDSLCSDRVLTMGFVDGVKVDKIGAVGSDPKILADAGMKLIGRMIFHHGFIHADLHPGNVLYLSGNRLAIFDLGLVGVLDADARRAFALLMYYAVHNLGAEVARWFYDRSPVKRVRDYPAYEREVSELLAAAYDRPLAETQITVLLFGIYDILRRHRLRTEATYTMAYIAIAVLEGMARRLDPQRNVARDIRPFVESALAMSAAQLAAPARPERAMPTAIASGRYRIRRLLGEGARKRVYLARDARLDRDVAVALIRADMLDPADRERIHLEARSVARLADHPRIVPVYDSGEDDGVPYVVSQYMAGGTLSGRLLRATQHRLPLETALRYADQILQALEHAHAHGVIHRDVKPENVWLTDDGFAKLGDFGLARVVGKADPSGEGTTVGTALYMAPEQALGRGGDHRSDLYSFGATLHELLTGRPPFEGESVAEVIARQIQATPEPPSLRNAEISAALDALVLKLLEKQPEHRFESAAAVRQALRELAAPEARSVPAPEAVTGAAPVFVGREQEMAKLRKGLDEALAGSGRLFVLVGEPGIGKTRAAELLASYASRRGCVVLTGRSFEGEGAPAYWPWVQILRSYCEARDAAPLESELGAGAAIIAQIVPEIRASFPDLAEMPALEGEEARFRLFDAITTFLKRASATQPLVLLLDDLHWADKPSLLLLQFVARELAGMRLLLVGTYRDVEVQYGHPLTELLPSLRRERVFERILLRGLPEPDVRALVVALAGAEVPGAFVRAISRETEGNPFFIEETLRHLAEEGVVSREGGRWASRISPDEIGLPEGIREVIGRRLARLSTDCRRMLSTASVLGRDFDARALERVSQLERERMTELLEEAASAQLVETEARGHRHRFTHALVRETLYAELGAGERVRLHQKIADALFAVHADDPAHVAELAYHACEAGPAGDVDRAVELARRAAEHAEAQFAYEEAVGFYERALRALETKDRVDAGRQCELLVELGAAQWNSGLIEKSKETLRHAADVAERSGRAETLARAALLYAGDELQGLFASVDQDMVPLLERALAALPEEAGALRAMVMGRLAGALTFSPQQQRKYELFDEAVSIATRIGDKRALATVSMARLIALWGSLSLVEIREELATLVRLFVELDDLRFLNIARLQHGVLAAEAGEPDIAELVFAEGERNRATIRHPGLRWLTSMLVSGWKLRAAKPEEAERITAQVFESSGIVGEKQVAFLVMIIQRMMTLWNQGRIDESAAVWAKAIATAQYSNTISIERVGALFIGAEVGRSADARALLDRLKLANIYRDTFWSATVVMCARGIEKVGDPERAREFYELLSAREDRVVTAGGALYLGSISGALGLLAKVMSRLDDAVRHFEAAVVIERGMPILLARTRYEFAQVLARRGVPGDRERALALLGQSIEGAREYEMQKVMADALALKLELEGIAAATPRSSIDVVAASLEVKGVDLRRATAPNGTVTLVFTDIEGFSETTERLGDAAAHRLMLIHNDIIRRELAGNEGTEVEAQGDGFLLAFPRATDALRFSIAVQRAFAGYRAEHAGEPIHVRMGLNAGEPIREGDRFFGKTVVLAARISAHARGDEILVSSVVRALAEASGDFAFGDGEDVALAGLSGRHRVYGLAWDPSAPARKPAPGASSSENVFRREGDFWMVTYAGRSLRLKDARGLQFLSALLRRQGEEVPALELVDGRAAGIERPGSGDREPRVAGDAERARKAVSSRVSDSIARIRKENPELGAHLGNSVRLGLLCRYEPERPTRWTV